MGLMSFVKNFGRGNRRSGEGVAEMTKDDLLSIINRQEEMIQSLQAAMIQSQNMTPSNSTALVLHDPNRRTNGPQVTPQQLAMMAVDRRPFNSSSGWGHGVKRFVRLDKPSDRIVFPENFRIDSPDPLEAREFKMLHDEIIKVVNGARSFNICCIRDTIDKCNLGAPQMSRYMDLLREYHCEDMNKDDPELFQMLPDILNYFFSNGAVPIQWRNE